MKCECNYHLGLGPNLKCPVHGRNQERPAEGPSTAAPADVGGGAPDPNEAVRELFLQLQDMAAQHRCGCDHPSCRRCWDDKDNAAALAIGEEFLALRKRWVPISSDENDPV